MNKISLVFLQSIKSNFNFILYEYNIVYKYLCRCNPGENLKEISGSCTGLTPTNLRKPRREHFALGQNDYTYLLALVFVDIDNLFLSNTGFML